MAINQLVTQYRRWVGEQATPSRLRDGLTQTSDQAVLIAVCGLNSSTPALAEAICPRWGALLTPACRRREKSDPWRLLRRCYRRGSGGRLLPKGQAASPRKRGTGTDGL